jgi:hypothetical protein
VRQTFSAQLKIGGRFQFQLTRHKIKGFSAHNPFNFSFSAMNIRIFMFAILVAFLASCSTTGTTGSNMTSPATGGSAFLTPAFIQGQATLAVQAAEIGLQSQPQYLVAFKLAAPIAGQLLTGIASGSGPLPTSAALQTMLATKLSGTDAKTGAIVQAIVASWYPVVYQQFSGDVTKAAPYLIAIGTALETA